MLTMQKNHTLIVLLEMAAIFWYMWSFILFFMPHWLMAFLGAIGNSNIALNVLYLALGLIPFEIILIDIIGKYKPKRIVNKWHRLGSVVLICDIVYGVWIYYGLDPFSLAQSIFFSIFLGINILFMPLFAKVFFIRWNLIQNSEIMGKIDTSVKLAPMIALGFIGIILLINQYWGNVLALMAICLLITIISDLLVPALQTSQYPQSSPNLEDSAKSNQSKSPRKSFIAFIILTALLCLDFWWQESYINQSLHIWLDLVLGLSTILTLILVRKWSVSVSILSSLAFFLLFVNFLIKSLFFEIMPLWSWILLQLLTGWVFGSWILGIWQLWTGGFKGKHFEIVMILYLLFSLLFSSIFAIGISMYLERELTFTLFLSIIAGVTLFGGFMILISLSKDHKSGLNNKEVSP